MAAILKLPKAEVLSFLLSEMKYHNSINIQKVEAIIERYGYPGKVLVGEPTNMVAFYVIQHSSKINKYLLLFKNAAKNNDLPFPSYAMMLDRYLMEKGEEQVYGSQLMGIPKKKNIPITPLNQKFVVWTIKDHKNVNKRRKEAGFKDTIEVYCSNFKIKYKHYTIKQIQKFKGFVNINKT